MDSQELLNELIRPTSDWLARRSARQQRDCSLWNPDLWGASVDSQGRLNIAGVDACNALDEYGSPMMLVNHAKLIQDVRNFLDAAETAFEEQFVTFSYKTNSVPGVLREIHDQGMGAEVISPYELWLAERLGVPGDRIVVNGVNKTREFLEHAAGLEVFTVNIDAPAELPMLLDIAERSQRRINVGLRLRVNPASHFGLDLDSGEALEVAAGIRDAGDLLTFTGLHFHAMADNDDPRRHAAMMEKALRFAIKIKFELGLPTHNLDIGGGMATPTVTTASRWQYARQRLFSVPVAPARPEERRPASDYLRTVATALHDFCRSADLDLPRVILEPGRIITSRSHVLLTKVHGLKRNPQGPTYALTDAGKILTSQPCDYEYHQIFVANRMLERPRRRYNLMGRLCTMADWLARNRFLPAIQPGDVLAIMDAGAYFTSYSTNFAFPRPPIVMARNAGTRLLRRQETPEHLMAMDVIEPDGAP